jgi:predicted metalloprotease with PDZ domain
MSRALRVAVLLLLPSLATAQNPYRHFTDAVDTRSSRTQPVVSYVLRVNPEDLSGYSVEMHVRNAPDTLRLALAAHPEYDDKYWRYVEGLSVESGITRDSVNRWHLVTRNGSTTVRYRIKLPPQEAGPRSAWKPFLSPTGGLVGGPHSFMYVIGATLAPSHVTLDLPQGWQVATGLTQTTAPNTWFAPTVDALMDSPMFVGRFSSWPFAIDGVPHRVVYWPSANTTPFDSVAFTQGIQRIVQQGINLFGRAPYRDFTFVMQDNAYGGLEHRNSVTLGVISANIARDVNASLGELAHEFTHTWNLMRIRPEEYGDVSYRTQPPVAGLWFSEGLTMHYADRFQRAAGLHPSDSTRAAHLEMLINRYLNSAGTMRFSPEAISRVAYNSSPGALGDYAPSVHLIGEIIGNVLDIIIRDATDNRRSMDDVMRLMLERYSGARGFNGRDIERTVAEVCGCNVAPFFNEHVRSATSALDFDRYFRLAGLRVQTTRGPSVNRDGTPAFDLRMRAIAPDSGGLLRMIVTDPASIWGKAGLHMQDELVSINGQPMPIWPDVARVVTGAHMGDTLRFEVRRKGQTFRPVVVMSGFDRTTAQLVEIPDVTDKQRRIRHAILMR